MTTNYTRRRRQGLWAILVLSSLLVAVDVRARAAGPDEAANAAKEGKGRYLRIIRDKNQTVVGLEVAVVQFASRDPSRHGPTVDLVGAVHIGDADYYARINRELARHDVVLYELVAPEGVKPRPGQAGTSPISFLQRAMKDMLELQFQLDAVRYDRPNMVHADMSPEELAKSMQERGESVWTMLMKMFTYAMSQQGKDDGPSDAALLMALLDKNRALALKRIMAEEFQDLEGTLAALGGKDGSALIEERNKVALGVLRKQLDAGKQNVAVFYGAGHFPDMARRLTADFNLVPVKTRWLLAWDMRDRKRG